MCKLNIPLRLLFALVLLAGLGLGAAAQSPDSAAGAPAATRYRYRVSFADKKANKYSLSNPRAFLSEKSLERRRRYGLEVDEHDLPVSDRYLNALRGLGLRVVNVSKWNNTAVVELTDTLCMQGVRRLPFVSATRLVWIEPAEAETNPDEEDRRNGIRRDSLKLTDKYYGHASRQVTMLGVDSLHSEGWRGRGVTIAVIDGGFLNADLQPGLPQERILGTRNFVHPGRSVYEEVSHGMQVLSCIAANEPHFLVGTAPEASFYLLQSEDGHSEQLVEEDNWCAAVEYADSLGCDIVTSSLGYQIFDYPDMSLRYADLDGSFSLNSRSASLAASRGLLVLNSAGNSGDDAWKKIGCPADARDILTVGAVNKYGVNTLFSSVGNTADGRVKPDVMAMGQSVSVYDVDGNLTTVSGTSFSCPILCGAVACLVQRFPHRRPEEIIRAVQRSGDRASAPDNIFGYGIPSLPKAARLLQ